MIMNRENFKSGFVSILGRPNVGKSTLLNALVGDKISIISPIPQTTRYQIKGILNFENAQVVFIDTPGIHCFKDKFTLHLHTVAKSSVEGCDLIIYVVDVTRRPGEEEEQLMNILSKQDIKIIMVLNKIDLRVKFINAYIDSWKNKAKNRRGEDTLLYYLPLSAKKGTNIDKLKDTLVQSLPEGHPYYDVNSLTDFPLKFRVADIIREKLFLNLKEELPHSLAVEIEEIKDKKKVIYIKANIYVKRNSQKKIIVGKEGEIMKEIGILSRGEIEKIYSKKVFLDIWVKVLENWQEKPRILKELGYWGV